MPPSDNQYLIRIFDRLGSIEAKLENLERIEQKLTKLEERTEKLEAFEGRVDGIIWMGGGMVAAAGIVLAEGVKWVFKKVGG